MTTTATSMMITTSTMIMTMIMMMIMTTMITTTVRGATTVTSAKRTTSRPKPKGAGGLTQVLLLGSMLATLTGTYILARQDQEARAAAAAQAAHTLYVPAVGSVGGVNLDLQPVPTLVPAPQRVRPVARTRSSR